MAGNDSYSSSTRGVRLRRLYRHSEQGLLITPLDHTLACGPIVKRGRSMDDLVAALTRGGSDAVVVHKGVVRHIHPQHRAAVSIVVHLNGSSPAAPDPDAKVMLCTVQEAVRLGADAVSLHINIGSDTETSQLNDLANTADECEKWGMPLLAMMYPRGPRVVDPRDPDLVLRAVTIGADLGADLVKTVHLPNRAELQDVAAQCPVPLLVAGGDPPENEAELLRGVREALAAGVGGLAMGRSLFQAADPQRTTARVAALVHRRPDLIAVAVNERQESHVDTHQTVLA